MHTSFYPIEIIKFSPKPSLIHHSSSSIFLSLNSLTYIVIPSPTTVILLYSQSNFEEYTRSILALNNPFNYNGEH